MNSKSLARTVHGRVVCGRSVHSKLKLGKVVYQTQIHKTNKLLLYYYYTNWINT